MCKTGFHEAIGDTLALSVATPKHLALVGLMNSTSDAKKDSQLAFLLKMAMEKIAFLPYGYILDMYRWKVFNGSISKENLNAEWWNLR
jgi:peptidyl-dipeptidase A